VFSLQKKDDNFMIAKKSLDQCVVTKPVVACSSLAFPFAACSDEAIFKASAAASFFFYSSAATFFFSSSAAFCLTSTSAAECVQCCSKKRVIIATISANKLQCWWGVGYNLLLPRLQPSSKLPLRQLSA
jgi:hypothetical protein